MKDLKDLSQFDNLAEKTKQNMVDFIRENCFVNKEMYELIQNVCIPKRKISNGTMAKLCKEVYTAWYKNTMRKFQQNTLQNSQIKHWIAQTENAPENLSEFDCFNMLLFGYKGVKFNLINLQNSGDDCKGEKFYCNEDSKNKAFDFDNFCHVCPFGRDKTTKRIYLNIPFQNIPTVIVELMQKCLNDEEKLYTKFYTNDGRNDLMLIYTNDEQLPKMIKYLDEIYAKTPELFLGGEGDLRFSAQIREWAGITDEPEYKHTSYNSNLAPAFYRYCDDLRKMCYKKIQQATGSKENLRNVVYSLALSVFQDSVQKNLKKYDIKPNPSEYDEANRKFYVEMSQKLINNDPKLFEEINSYVSNALENMEKGWAIGTKLCLYSRIPYLNKEEKASDINGYNIKEINSGKQVLHVISFRLQLMERLLDKYDLTDEFNSKITFDALAPYLEEQHISPDYPFFNLETQERYLNQTQTTNVGKQKVTDKNNSDYNIEDTQPNRMGEEPNQSEISTTSPIGKTKSFRNSKLKRLLQR